MGNENGKGKEKETDNKSRINIAYNIAARRKKLGMTQNDLAARLFVSNKTVSKWERGAGYPELPALLDLSDILGVPVDTLIRGEKYGIAIGGNLLVDHVKLIEKFPKPGMLSGITEISHAVGGCVPNTGIDLAKIDRSIPISAHGLVGDDESGRYVIGQLRANGIDTGAVRVEKSASTGFSDVMTEIGTGDRTFFHHRGANMMFSPADIDISSLKCRMFHIGYILLLDSFDASDSEYGTVMAHFLHDLREAGIRTSFDLVSSSDGDFAAKVIPALRYTDNAIMNEIEAGGVSGIPPRDEEGRLLTDNVRKSMEFIYAQGIGERVIVHSPEAGFCLSESGFTVMPSLKLPRGYIKGAVGAGDAFAAGCLYGLYQGMDDAAMLEFASGAAACSLSAEDSVSGMKNRDAILSLIRKSEKRKI